MTRILILSILLSIYPTKGFVTPVPSSLTIKNTSLNAKGFSTKDNNATPPKKSKNISQGSSSEATSSSAPGAVVTNEDKNPFPKFQESDMSQGKVALEKMRRERAEQRNKELLKVKEVQEVDAMVRESPEAAVIPEKVAQRMGKRMLPFVGIPLFGAMGSFVGFWYFATYRDQEFQPALVAAVSIGLLAVGLVGITYSIMSASWDVDREGSFLGTEEFSRNLDNIKTGLSRSRENAILRDRANDFSPADYANLERMEEKATNKEKRSQSFSEKFGEELE